MAKLLVIYTKQLVSPMGNPAGTRVFALSNVVWRQTARGKSVDLKNSEIYMWTGAYGASDLARQLKQEGFQCRIL